MHVSIVAPEERVWEGEADLVIARSPDGDFGIMRGHVPFLAALVPGLVTVVRGQQRDAFIVPGGFLEASGTAEDYHVIVLADDAQPAGDMDAAEARRRLQDAARRADADQDQASDAQLRASLARAEAESGEYSSR